MELMNEGHLRHLASPEWARYLESELLPWITTAADLGDDLLEVGPGPGLTTDLLRRRAAHVTAIELDERLAGALAQRLAGSNVAVINGDGTDTGLPANRFSSAMCFSVLHHMPSADVQDRLFAELNRVLRSGAAFLGTDSTDSETIRQAHLDDTFVPVPPETLAARLQAAGFTDVEVGALDENHIRFVATKP